MCSSEKTRAECQLKVGNFDNERSELDALGNRVQSERAQLESEKEERSVELDAFYRKLTFRNQFFYSNYLICHRSARR